MLSELLEKYKLSTKSVIMLIVALLASEVCVRLGIILLWNWIVSIDVNCLIFGTEKLGLLKGLVSLSVLLAVTGRPFVLIKQQKNK